MSESIIKLSKIVCCFTVRSISASQTIHVRNSLMSPTNFHCRHTFKEFIALLSLISEFIHCQKAESLLPSVIGCDVFEWKSLSESQSGKQMWAQTTRNESYSFSISLGSWLSENLRPALIGSRYRRVVVNPPGLQWVCLLGCLKL